MEKTYKFELPQREEVESTNVRIEDGKVFVDVKFKERFQPKDGDFIVAGYKEEDGSCYWISIIRDCKKYSHDIITKDYVTYIFQAEGSQKNSANKILFNKGTEAAEEIRFATQEEKASFLERLEKECGKRWNPETKTLDPIRWRAKFGGYYYAMNPGFEVAQYQEADVVTDDNRYNSGNYFQTPEEAQPYVDKVKEMFKNA